MSDQAQRQAPGRVAVLTSGGDAPGMNAAIRAATMFLRHFGVDVVGVRQGYRGLMAGDFRELAPGDVAGIAHVGGTLLGSARSAEFQTVEGRRRAREQLAQAGIGGVIVIGGNGSLTGADRLGDPAEGGDDAPAVVGIPASIDNDVGLTGMAIGVDTAMNTITEACDRITDTASAHDRTFLVEVMGRHCGYLAMTTGVAAAAEAVLFPEADKDEDELVETAVRAVIRAHTRAGRTKRVLVIVAEGTALGVEGLRRRLDARLAEALPDREIPVETRVSVLGHVVRGGRPTAFDRLLAGRLAHVAVRAILAGETRQMAGWLMPLAPPPEVARQSEHDPYCYLVDLPAVLAATERLLSGEDPITKWRRRIFAEVEDILAG